MRGGLLLCCLGAPVAAQSPAAQSRTFVEIVVAADTYFVQQPIRVRLRFGVEARFLAESVIQPFRQPLDLPVRLEADWLEDLPGTVALGDPGHPRGEDARGASFVLGGRRSVATRAPDRRVGDQRFVVLEIERSYLPQRPGELVIPAARLRFAFATRFREDFVKGRVPEDRQDGVVSGEPRTVRIRALPLQGRPPGFAGAVGRYSVRAEASPRALRVGESLKLDLHIEGAGNLAFFDPPRLDELRGFHVRGRIEDFGRKRRTITYDLAPLADTVREIPALSFSFFDPEPPIGYRTVATRPLPLEVRPSKGGERNLPLPRSEAQRDGPGRTDIHDLKPVSGSRSVGTARGLSPALLVVVLLVPWLLALGLVGWRRAQARRPGAAELRARGAATVFRERTDRGEDLAESFVEFLAARLRRPAASVIAPELSVRLVAAGIPEELAERAATRLDGLVATRYGGDAAADRATTRQLVDALEASFQTMETGR